MVRAAKRRSDEMLCSKALSSVYLLQRKTVIEKDSAALSFLK